MTGPAPSLQIPNLIHFVWFGADLPDFAVIAIRSALRLNPGAKAVLWHDADFQPSAEVLNLGSQGLSLQRIDPESLISQLHGAGAPIDVPLLRELYFRLEQPAAKANMVRMMVLYLLGGIYLDTDTLTVKSFDELRRTAAFCGEEHVLWPATVSRASLRPLLLAEVRHLCSSLPRGYRLHRKLLSLYSLAANNAVMGARKGHPLLLQLLQRATQVPRRQWTRRFRLGTHLLQEALASYRQGEHSPEDDVRVLAPDYFYPVGPRISRHYFRRRANPEAVAAELLRDNTHVIHWYASVSDLSKFDYEHILRSEPSEVYSFLCRRHVGAGELAQPAVVPPVGAEPAW